MYVACSVLALSALYTFSLKMRVLAIYTIYPRELDFAAANYLNCLIYFLSRNVILSTDFPRDARIRSPIARTP